MLLLFLLQLGRTPLHLACEKGHVAAATALVAGGADLLAKDRVSCCLQLCYCLCCLHPVTMCGAVPHGAIPPYAPCMMMPSSQHL